jgi:hypothetical protein
MQELALCFGICFWLCFTEGILAKIKNYDSQLTEEYEK